MGSVRTSDLSRHTAKGISGIAMAETTGGRFGRLRGAGIGSSAGPVGALRGGIAGAIGGWWTGRGIAEAAEKLSGDDEAEFRTHYETSDSRVADRPYDDVRGA